MMRFYSKTALTALLFTLLCTGVRAQTTLAEQSFEGAGTWAFTPSPPTYNVSGDVWAAVASIGSINPTDGANLWGMQDLNNPNGGGNFDHVLAFDAITTAGETAMELSFEWNVQSLNTGGDLISYEYFLDGIGQGVVILAAGAPVVTNTGWVTETVVIPDGTASVALNLMGNFNGSSDIAGYDNVLLTADNPADPCGITSFGPENVVCLTESTDPGTDLFRIEIPYSGMDADATLLVEAGATTPANDVTSTTANVGDPFTTTANGTIILENSAGEFEEGDEIRVTLTDAGGNCSFVLNISTTENQCSNTCDFSVDPADLRLFCVDFTNSDNVDQVGGTLDFSGSEPGVMATITGSPGFPTIVSGDPATDENGEIAFAGLVEGGSYTITFSGGVCPTTTIPFSVPANFCTPGALIINEIFADPGTTLNATNDANGDGTLSSSADEFVELYNTSLTDLDVSGYRLEEGAGARYEFPASTIIPARSGFVIFGGGTPTGLSCQTDVANLSPFLGLNNGADIVIIRDAAGNIVAQHAYTSGPDDESLALDPDFNTSANYVPHTSIAANPVRQSACERNNIPGASLPVELTSFTATPSGKTVRLNWATEGEDGNDRFVVERSIDGFQWLQLGAVRASGYSAADYAFTDETPANGHNLYRLRQLDLDGAFALYGPVMAEFTATAGVYPNPVKDELYLQGFSANVRVNLLDASGKVLWELPAGTDRADVANLRPGMYMLRISGDKGVEVLRFVKQ